MTTDVPLHYTRPETQWRFRSPLCHAGIAVATRGTLPMASMLVCVTCSAYNDTEYSVLVKRADRLDPARLTTINRPLRMLAPLDRMLQIPSQLSIPIGCAEPRTWECLAVATWCACTNDSAARNPTYSRSTNYFFSATSPTLSAVLTTPPPLTCGLLDVRESPSQTAWLLAR